MQTSRWSAFALPALILKDFAQRAVSHAQKIRPPITVVTAHYWKQ
jgi:hypothetical protein